MLENIEPYNIHISSVFIHFLNDFFILLRFNELVQNIEPYNILLSYS